MMRFRLLGSAAGKTVPRPFCRCRVCRHAKLRRGRDLRTRTAMHVFIDGDGGPEPLYQVDLPPDVGHHMLRDGFCMERLEHLLFTHADEDHLDPKSLLYRKTILSDMTELPPLNVYGGAAVREKLDASGVDWPALKMSFHEVRPLEPFALGGLDVFPIPARHTPGSFNYVLRHGGRSVLLAWDTGLWPEENWAAVRPLKLDAVFMECTVLGPDEVRTSGHLDFPKMLRMRARLIELGCVQPRAPFVAVHIGDNGLLTYDEAVALASPYGVTVGYDGLELEV